jgi:hypothetical protein
VKRTVTGGARANTGNVEEGINSPKSIQARSNGIPHCKLVTDIRGSKTCLTEGCCHSLAFICVATDDKHGIFGSPKARRSGRDSR